MFRQFSNRLKESVLFIVMHQKLPLYNLILDVTGLLIG